MITVLTGLPGNGKTLFALWFVKKYLESENKRLKSEAEKSGAVPVVREVFYSGITDLALPWTEIDATEWNKCPPGSIIVIDEAQKTFPLKPNGSKLPDYYEELATHRHKGYDIFVITQHPSLIHNFVRMLCGRHFHAVRKFGMSRATIYEWSATNAGPQSAASQKAAIPLKWSYPTEVYSYYKSAEVHTVKRAIPMKLILGVLFVVGMIVTFYLVLDAYQNRAKKAQLEAHGGVLPAGGSVPGAARGPGAAGGVGGPAFVDPMMDAKRFVFEATPRVEGIAHTAPKYDQMTKPVRVPVPAMCIRKKLACKCYTQQGTHLQVPMNMCYEISYSGYFQEFNPEGQSEKSVSVQPVQSNTSVDSGSSPAVTVMPMVPNTSVYARTASK